MVLLDVVYNHFGPEGNYLHAYAPQFFNARHRTPWGAAINFDGEGSRAVRDFFIHNALYWLEEFHFDGLRLDAVHAIVDDSQPDIVTEISQRVRERLGRRSAHVHLVLENDRNEARYLRATRAATPPLATAQWNDDLHHALHVLATGEPDGYYADYATRPLAALGRCLAEGFAYQGEASRLSRRRAARRAEQRAAAGGVRVLPAESRPDRQPRVRRAPPSRWPTRRRSRALTACVLLAPSPPMLFMGEEFGAHRRRSCSSAISAGDLADAVTRRPARRVRALRALRRSGRRGRRFPIPTRARRSSRSKLDWREAVRRMPGADVARVLPALPGRCAACTSCRSASDIAGGGAFASIERRPAARSRGRARRARSAPGGQLRRRTRPRTSTLPRRPASSIASAATDAAPGTIGSAAGLHRRDSSLRAA